MNGLMKFLLLLVALLIKSSFTTQGRSDKPNFLILVADDLGYGDVGVFGNRTIPTPNIDSIGHRGVVFTHALAAASLCTPSRAALLTGRYPVRYGMTSSFTNRVILFVAQSGGLPVQETSFAKVLKDSNEGYQTALIGKWHLGNDGRWRGDGAHHPNKHGFDYFYGTVFTNLKDFKPTSSIIDLLKVWNRESVITSQFPNMYRVMVGQLIVGVLTAFWLVRKSSLSFKLLAVAIILMSVGFFLFPIAVQFSLPTINSILMKDQKVIEQPFYSLGSTRRFVNEGKEFISRAVQSGNPFLLIVNFLKVHTAHLPDSEFAGQSSHGPFGDCVLELDWGVGQLLQHLDHLGIMENTLVFFTSDNGGHLEEVNRDGQQQGGYNGILRGGKGHGAMEGGIRVPTLGMWPKVIPSKTKVIIPISLMDIFPTVIEAAGIGNPEILASLDGKSLLPILSSKESGNQYVQDHHKFLFHYCGSYLHGVTYTEDSNHIWKVYYYTPRYKNDREDKCSFVCQCFGGYVVPHAPPSVFNLATDPSEQNDLKLANSSKYQQIVQTVKEAAERHRKSLESSAFAPDEQLNLWNSIWRPDLQPCCNFPWCRCLEERRK